MKSPILPSQIGSAISELAKESIPGFVIEAFNEMIVENYNKEINASRFDQNQVIERILIKAKNEGSSLTRTDIFSNRLLDVEPIFEANGWKVKYTKPPYFDPTIPYFTFSEFR